MTLKCGETLHTTFASLYTRMYSSATPNVLISAQFSVTVIYGLSTDKGSTCMVR